MESAEHHLYSIYLLGYLFEVRHEIDGDFKEDDHREGLAFALGLNHYETKREPMPRRDLLPKLDKILGVV